MLTILFVYFLNKFLSRYAVKLTAEHKTLQNLCFYNIKLIYVLFVGFYINILTRFGDTRFNSINRYFIIIYV